jgi:hypothetical protein
MIYSSETIGKAEACRQSKAITQAGIQATCVANMGKNFDAAPAASVLGASAPAALALAVLSPAAPAPTILYSKPTVFKRTKVNIGIGTTSF